MHRAQLPEVQLRCRSGQRRLKEDASSKQLAEAAVDQRALLDDVRGARTVRLHLCFIYSTQA